MYIYVCAMSRCHKTVLLIIGLKAHNLLVVEYLDCTQVFETFKIEHEDFANLWVTLKVVCTSYYRLSVFINLTWVR